MCKVSGCESTVTRWGGMCQKHHMRMYRNGTTEKVNQPKPYNHSQGYILVPADGHPLAKGSSHHYEHRVVYYDAHGAGPFQCHWCAKEVEWSGLHIDHLNDDKKDNRLENLVPSCPVCNQGRGQHKIQDSWRKKTGVTAFGITLTLNEWSERVGITRQSILWRLKNGWPIERALSEKRGITGPKTNKENNEPDQTTQGAST